MKTHASFDGRRKTSPQTWWTWCAEIVIWFNLMILYLPIICILICHYLPIWSYLILSDPIYNLWISLRLSHQTHLPRWSLPAPQSATDETFKNFKQIFPRAAGHSRYIQIPRNDKKWRSKTESTESLSLETIWNYLNLISLITYGRLWMVNYLKLMVNFTSKSSNLTW